MPSQAQFLQDAREIKASDLISIDYLQNLTRLLQEHVPAGFAPLLNLADHQLRAALWRHTHEAILGPDAPDSEPNTEVQTVRDFLRLTALVADDPDSLVAAP